MMLQEVATGTDPEQAWHEAVSKIGIVWMLLIRSAAVYIINSGWYFSASTKHMPALPSLPMEQFWIATVLPIWEKPRLIMKAVLANSLFCFDNTIDRAYRNALGRVSVTFAFDASWLVDHENIAFANGFGRAFGDTCTACNAVFHDFHWHSLFSCRVFHSCWRIITRRICTAVRSARSLWSTNVLFEDYRWKGSEWCLVESIVYWMQRNPLPELKSG